MTCWSHFIYVVYIPFCISFLFPCGKSNAFSTLGCEISWDHDVTTPAIPQPLSSYPVVSYFSDQCRIYWRQSNNQYTSVDSYNYIIYYINISIISMGWGSLDLIAKTLMFLRNQLVQFRILLWFWKTVACGIWRIWNAKSENGGKECYIAFGCIWISNMTYKHTNMDHDTSRNSEYVNI